MSQSIAVETVKKVFRQLKNLHVMVVGDCMLDEYWHGITDRISPEAPVPVLQLTRKEQRPGGASNVALNCASLGAQVQLFSVIGNDHSGNTLIQLLKNAGIETQGCLRSKDRITGTKTRLLSKQQQLLRIDEETTEALNTRDEHQFIDTCMRALQIDKPDVLIIEDYNKGLLSKNGIQHIIEHAKRVGVLIAVDPKKDHFFDYQGVDIFKPNLKELRDAFQINWNPTQTMSLKKAHSALQKKLQHKISLFTLSEFGMYVNNSKEVYHTPAYVRAIADVSGAGDTVISVFTLFYAISKDLYLSLQAANLSGGLVCEKPGVVPINKKELEKEFISKIRS